MILFSSIIKQFETEFLAHYSNQLLPSMRHALGVMKNCRSQYSPRMLAQCVKCEHQTYLPHSCGHRNCPHCQAHESQHWIERQLKKQVPAEYFFITFTLPAQCRSLVWFNQRKLYSMMTQCAWDTLRTFSKNDPQLQGTPGVTSVLHTHSRCLDFHPHVHIVMPAAAIDSTKKIWRTKNTIKSKGKNKTKGKPDKSYLFNHEALAIVFRAKLLDAITKAGLELPKNYPEKWVVNCKSVGSGEKAVIYLGRYLYRGVIQEMEYKTLSGAKFLWRVLQHVLPKGFRRARNFGFLHPNSKRLIALLQLLVNFDPSRALAWMRTRPQWLCPCCSATMKVIETRLAPLFSFRKPVPT